MPASYPKPDDQRVTRHPQKFGWMDLPPAGRDGAPPKLPNDPSRKWSAETRRWWRMLWAKPQATMWEQDGSTLWTLARLYDDMVSGRSEPVKVSAEMRQIEDRHGLNPKAMLQLRWRVTAEGAEESTGRADAGPLEDRRRALKVV
jgi:hypothetical protein